MGPLPTFRSGTRTLYYPKEAYDAVAHRMCDLIEAWMLQGCQWAFHIANLGEDTTDAPLHEHWEDAVRKPNQFSDLKVRGKGKDAFYSAKGRAAVATIARGIGRSMLAVFQARGLAFMLSPDLMEMFGDHESRNAVDRMLGGSSTNSGYFDIEIGDNPTGRYSGLSAERILDGKTASEIYTELGEPNYVPTQGANQAANYVFSNLWRPVLRMANEQSVKEAIVDPIRQETGSHFKAMNYAMFSATNPSHCRRHGRRGREPHPRPRP